MFGLCQSIEFEVFMNEFCLEGKHTEFIRQEDFHRGFIESEMNRIFISQALVTGYLRRDQYCESVLNDRYI